MKKIIIYVGILILMPMFLMAQVEKDFLYSQIIHVFEKDNTNVILDGAYLEKQEQETDKLISEQEQKQYQKKQKQILNQSTPKSELTDYEKSLIRKITYEEGIQISKKTETFSINKHKNIVFIETNHNLFNHKKEEDKKEIERFNNTLKKHLEGASIFVVEYTKKELEEKHNKGYKNISSISTIDPYGIKIASNSNIPIYPGDVEKNKLISDLIKEGVGAKDILLYYMFLFIIELEDRGHKWFPLDPNKFNKTKEAILVSYRFEKSIEKEMRKLSYDYFNTQTEGCTLEQFISMLETSTQTPVEIFAKTLSDQYIEPRRNFLHKNVGTQNMSIRDVQISSIIKKHAINNNEKIVVMYGAAHYHSLEPLFKHWDSLEKEKK